MNREYAAEVDMELAAGAFDAAALHHHLRGVGPVAVAERDGGVWFGEAPPPRRGGVAVLAGFGASGDLREPLPVEVAGCSLRSASRYLSRPPSTILWRTDQSRKSSGRLNLLIIACNTGLYISVPGPWSLIGNCGPRFEPGLSGLKRIISDPFPRCFFDIPTMPKGLSRFKSSRSLNGLILDTAGLPGHAHLCNYPGRYERVGSFRCGRCYADFFFLRAVTLKKLFPEIRRRRMVKIVQIALAESEIDLCADQVVKVALDPIECVTGGHNVQLKAVADKQWAFLLDKAIEYHAGLLLAFHRLTSCLVEVPCTRMERLDRAM